MRPWVPPISVLLALAIWSAAAALESPSDRTPSPQMPTAQKSDAAQAPDELVVGGKVVGRLVQPSPGDLCMVCNQPIHPGDVVYLVQGQRVPIHLGECNAALRARPQSFLAKLTPHGAFLGAGQEGVGLSPAWFFVGLYVLTGLIFAAMCAHQALQAGHNPVAWFGMGLALNAFGYLLLLTRPRREARAPAGVPAGLRKVPATYTPQPCPRCGAANHPSAGECTGCGGKLQPAMESEVHKAGLRSKLD